MRTLALILLVLVLAWPATAYDLGTSRPTKPETQVTPPPPDPDVLRQGGDTVDDAFVIGSLPFFDPDFDSTLLGDYSRVWGRY